MQPEPQDVNIDELQSVHHAAQGPGPKQEPISKGAKGKEKGGKGDSPSDPQPKSGEVSGKGSGKGDSPVVPKAKPKAKADAGPTPMELDPSDAQPKKSWIAVAVEGARPRTTPSPKASEVQAPKAEPKRKATPVPKAAIRP